MTATDEGHRDFDPLAGRSNIIRRRIGAAGAERKSNATFVEEELADCLGIQQCVRS